MLYVQATGMLYVYFFHKLQLNSTWIAHHLILPFDFMHINGYNIKKIVERKFWCILLICLLIRLVTLITFLAVLSILSRTCIPWFLKLMISLSSQVCIFFSQKIELCVCVCVCVCGARVRAWSLNDLLWFVCLIKILPLQTNELYQLASVAFCLLVAWVCFTS